MGQPWPSSMRPPHKAPCAGKVLTVQFGHDAPKLFAIKSSLSLVSRRLRAALLRLLARLLHELMGKPITPVPEGARRIGAPFAFIVYALLVRAGHEAVRHGDRLHAVDPHKRQHVRCNLRVLPHVAMNDLPITKLRGKDAHCDFRGAAGVWPMAIRACPVWRSCSSA